MLRTVTLTVLLLVSLSRGNGKRRNLLEIRYHFTPCGKTGRMGPSYQDCVDYYTSISSPIIRDNVLTDTHSSVFIGSQSFRAPRATVYNVTIAGAAGGRGLCNSEYGKGLVQYTYFTPYNTSFAYLILVGQRGLGPCDTGEPDPGHMLCQNSPQNLEDSASCNETYHQWLMSLSRANAERTLTFSGGAGGGGASFFGYRDSRPFLDIRARGYSGGGGGSSAILDFAIVQFLLPQLTDNVSKYATLYRDILNANSTTYNPVVDSNHGFRGYRVESASVTAGAGGGILNSIQYPSSHEDGRAFGRIEDFALGGTHCARNDYSHIPLQLRGGDGGFGGGGGGCGGGGGGGGYTGGAVLGDTNTTPGGGGYSFHSASCNTAESCNVPLGSYTYNSEGDGYVDIVAADCGCVYACVVYEEEDQFECLCPKGTQLAPDLSDCYYSEERNVEIVEFETVSTSDITFRGVIFGSSTFIFSVDVSLSASGSRQRRQSTSEGDRCVLMFIGDDNNIVLATNPVIGSSTATTLSEVSLNLTSGTLTMTDYVFFLNSSVLVTGAVLASTGDCEIGDTIAFNISMQESDNEVNFTSVVDKLLKNSNVLNVLSSQVLQHPTPVTRTVMPSSLISQLPSPMVTLSQTVLPSLMSSPTDDNAEKQSAPGVLVTSLSVAVATFAVLVIALISVIIFKRLKKVTSQRHLEPKVFKQNEAYAITMFTDHIYEEISKEPIQSTEDSSQHMQSQQPLRVKGMKIVNGNCKDTVGDTQDSDGENERYVTKVQGSDEDSDYYVNDP